MPAGFSTSAIAAVIILSNFPAAMPAVRDTVSSNVVVTVPSDRSPFHFVSAGTPLRLSLDRDLTPHQVRTGDHFTATLLDDITSSGSVVIPRNSTILGDVTYSSREGGHGRAAIIAIALRCLTTPAGCIAVEGRYRETGASRDDALAVGLLLGVLVTRGIRGGGAIIPRGRVLRARLGEDVARIESPPPIAVTITPTAPGRQSR